jgi:hypothetical protein
MKPCGWAIAASHWFGKIKVLVFLYRHITVLSNSVFEEELFRISMLLVAISYAEGHVMKCPYDNRWSTCWLCTGHNAFLN